MTGRVADITGQAFNFPYNDGDGAGKFQNLGEVFCWQAQTDTTSLLYTLLDNRVS